MDSRDSPALSLSLSNQIFRLTDNLSFSIFDDLFVFIFTTWSGGQNRLTDLWADNWPTVCRHFCVYFYGCVCATVCEYLGVGLCRSVMVLSCEFEFEICLSAVDVSHSGWLSVTVCVCGSFCPSLSETLVRPDCVAECEYMRLWVCLCLWLCRSVSVWVCVFVGVLVWVFVILWWIEIECASYDPMPLGKQKIHTQSVLLNTLYYLLFMEPMCVKLFHKKVYGQIGQKLRERLKCYKSHSFALFDFYNKYYYSGGW